jgi:glucose/arabinose dehydrogenase
MKWPFLSFGRTGPDRKPTRPRTYQPRVETLEDRVTPATLPPGFHLGVLAAGLAAPTAMEVAPDGRVFVAEQGGTLRVIDNGVLQPTPFVTLPVDPTGERGLVGVTVDPNYLVNHFVYVYYTTAAAPVHNRVSRFTASGDVAVPGSEVDLLDLEPLGATNHNGGGLHFGLDGKLYIGVGENANPGNAQTLANRLGKLLRINPDGSIPADNPFVGVAAGVNQAIWALGLRNPFTFAVQPGSGRIFINDVGQNTWEEIDLGVPGANYGWPITEGPTSDPRFRGPIFAYGHGQGNTLGFAITGGVFYNPAQLQFPAEFAGTYFFADLVNGWIRRLDPATGAVTGFATGLPSGTVDLRVDASGSLLVLSRGPGANTGAIFRIEFTNLALLERFVSSAFLDLLGRPADPVSLVRFTNRLLHGVSLRRLVQQIQQLPEYRRALVRELYSALLGQQPTLAALRSGVAFLQSGGQVQDLMAQIIGSPAYFFQRGLGTLAGFADAVSRDVLGQPAGAALLVRAARLHSRSARIQFAAQLLRSVPGRLHLAQGLVQRFLHQSVDPAVVLPFIRALGRPHGYEDLVAGLVGSLSYLLQV